MKKMFFSVLEFGVILFTKKKQYKVLITLLLFLTSAVTFSQTIPGTGSNNATCGDCTPTGWLDFNGTPDISRGTIAGGQGTIGAEATWSAGILPNPPTGHATWITMKDLGGNGTEESVRTTMGDLEVGKLYRLTIYTMSATSNANGGTGNNEYYGGTHKQKFDYQVGKNAATLYPRQVVNRISKNEWGKTYFYFIGNPDNIVGGKGTMVLNVFPGEYSAYPGIGNETPENTSVEPLHIAVELNAIEKIDTDGDGIDDTIDIDDDNDGILDTVELTVNGTTYDPLGDEDGDFLPNYLDVRDDNGVGDSSTTNYDDINGDGIPNVYDFDNDGIPNHLDLDSDNDGIPDIIEAQSTSGYIPPNGVVGVNGLDSAYESGDDTVNANGLGGLNGAGLINFDSNGNPDYLDLDSDGDGVSDTIEGNINLSGDVGENGLDDAYDNGSKYTDVNGSFDNTQLNNFPNTSAADSPDDVNWRDSGTIIQKDTDGDGIPDSVDIDDDNDGIIDTVECATVNRTQSNASSVQSQSSVTNSGNSIGSDNLRATLNSTSDVLTIDLGVIVPKNTIIEIESRITGSLSNEMKIEQSSTTSNFTNPKVFNWIALNTEQNKEYKLSADARYIQITLAVYTSGTLEIDNILYQAHDVVCDSDGDGIPNIVDLDSDNDGIPDNIEAQATTNQGGSPYIAPGGSVGANGLYSVYENNDTAGATGLGGAGGAGLINTDSGNDAIPDYLDSDSDNDGISDRAEANLSISGNFGANGLDANYDVGDGYTDTNGSFDNTQTDNFPDADNDVNDGSGDDSGDVDYRDADSSFSDNDNDGIPDATDLDDDNDGILDTEEGFDNCSGTITSSIFTITTAGGTTTDNINLTSLGVAIGSQVVISNIQAEGDLDGGSETFTVNINSGSYVSPSVNTGVQCSTTLGFNPLTSPITQTVSVIDIGSGTPGITILADASADVGVLGGCTGAMRYTIQVSCSPALDTDNDGVPNYLDLDSDNDGIPDNIEAQSTIGYITPNGVFNANGIDTAYSTGTNGLTPQDTDGDGLKDYLETDSDNDGLLDNTEAGTSISGVFGTNGLDANYDNGDNYTDVNGNYDNSQTNNFPDVDGDVFSGGDVDYRDDTFTNDIDGDGVSNETDLDDDNDGILDTVEIGTCSVNNGILDWDAEYTEGTTTETSGDDPITTNANITNANVEFRMSRTTNVGSDSNYRINDFITTNSSYTIRQRASIGAESRHIFDLSAPIYNLSFTIYDINRETAATATDDVQVILTKQDGSTYTLLATDYTTGASYTYSGGTFTGTTTGTSNVTIGAIPAWIVKIQIVYKNVGTGTVTPFNESQDIALGNFTYCTPLDTDGDGVFDYIDLDSDNDGIPDNFEAQPTGSYIPPTGSYGITGIDLAYGNGVTPENTDATAIGPLVSDTIPDYLDPDSDGDGTNDVLESSLGGALPNDGSKVTGTFGTNGLLDTLDNGDTYNDVNGSFDNTVSDNFTDSDNDVTIGGDLDYRDTVVGVDTDKDGIGNATDIDDDNDGITDISESGGNNPDGDEDGDGTPNYRDNSDGGNGGDGSTTNYTDTNNDGIPDVYDFDNDGVPNHLDIDTDNDGIPDNIEAQTTVGYVPPSTDTDNDADNDGLNDAYDTDCTVGSPCGTSNTVGVDISTTPRNTDNTDNPDYKDLDSDNDGKPDIEENGDSDNSISGNDSDGDGLDDNFEGSDLNDGYDVNDEINTPQTDLPDVDSDVTTDDVDYRDSDDDPVSPNYSGNTLWLRADKDVTGGNDVTLWSDQTPGNADFVGDGTPDVTVTANNLNFNPTVTFVQADNDVLRYTGNLNPRTMYIVYKDAATTNWTTPFTNDDADGIGHGHSDDSQLYNTTWTPPDVRNGAEYVNGLSSDFLTKSRPDNYEIHSRVYLSNISNESRNYYVGRDREQGTDRVIDGAVAEVILYSDAHTDARRQEVETYLAIKYGFTLDVTDNSGSIVEGDYILTGGNPTIWDYTTNAAYHNDVAGIGRDDAMDLDQFQSKSVNSDAIITIGLGAIASTNLTNGNSFTNNKDFLVWGNDNGVINNTTTSELVCAPEITIGRKWKIEENGTVGSVQIAVNRSTIDAALVTPNTLKVLKVADDANFTSNVDYVPLEATSITDSAGNNENVYSANYDFNGTKYFTYTEINGIFWNGATTNAADRWKGGNSGSITGGPSTNAADVDKVMVIDAQGSSNHATLAEDVEVECVWIKANSKLMVQNNKFLEFDEDFILDGELRLIGNGQLIQTHTGLSNVQGDGKLFRDQAAIVPSIYRYHYWTSPVRELNKDNFRVGQVMFDGNEPTAENSPIRSITWDGNGNLYDGKTGSASPYEAIKIAPYWIYSYLNGEDQSDWVQQWATGVIERGQGYSMKSTGQNPQNFTFIGTPNDGSITFNFTANRTSLLGNPYPSALDAVNFINTNINEIDGTLYFWEHTGEDNIIPASSEGHNLTGYQGGYSQRNIAMGVAANSVPASAAVVFDWENATISNNKVVQTVDGITATVEFSSGNAIKEDISLIAQPTDYAIENEDGNGSYTMTVSFNQKVDMESIKIYNDILGTTPLNLTISAGINFDDVTTSLTNTASLVIDKTVSLSWKDVFSFTISSSTPFKIGLNDMKLRKGNLPSIGGGTYHAPNRYIAVAQGFFVSSSNTGGTVRFENSMRAFEDDNYTTDGSGGGSGTYFFKGSKKSSNHKQINLLPILKLGFNYKDSNNAQLHRQLGISFRRGNDFKYDNGYDSEIYDLGSTDFYWQFPEYSDKKLIIAGVSEISNSLRVPIVLKIDTDNPILIQIDEKNNISKNIYLQDALSGKSYELSKSNLIELNIEKGIYTNRFFLTFGDNNGALNNQDNLLNNKISIFLKRDVKELILQNSSGLVIKKLEMFNILGQKSKSWNTIETKNTNKFSVKNFSNAVYIVKITTEIGIFTKKIIIE
ncbi:T9SS type A sorting domain-containing protein [Polaribacter aquimarinus]|uniref:DUF8202 domain-containing protein n=1 Tax=Polaribacter aquimarinus TaxID=2100726 RepID=A0A2U2J9G8_9FLAO|nr:T9SS type A sorting domain-containing protein [Polaribacter aquimarinus]PWG04983.1 hypothetical protein DIS07_10995 [Polaribacter aquimarinus]